MTVTNIYRVKTMNSIYEIQVRDTGVSRCRKDGADQIWRVVTDATASYLEKLVIGASFDVPGVVTTSVVKDYMHYVVSPEPKRHAEIPTTMGQFFGEILVDAIKDAAMGHRPVQVVAPERVYKGYGPGCSEDNHVGGCTCDLPPACDVAGCTYSSKYGPSHEGSRMCKSGSIASGGTRSHCACDACY
jgi:hypothetical protein